MPRKADYVFGNKFILPKGRVVHPYLVEPNNDPTYGKGKFMLRVVCAKDFDYSKLDADIDRIIETHWEGAKTRKDLKLPYNDGDGKGKEMYAGSYYFNPKSGQAPDVYDRKGNRISADEIYAGCWARVCVTPYTYPTGSPPGVALRISSIMFWADDEPLSSADTTQDFASVLEDGEDLEDY